jgi:glycosyltransferase involved in cell wall biosynthesis
MALGVPQIAPEIAGYTEYCTRDNSILVKPRYRSYLPQAYGPVTGQIEIVDTDDVSKAMERYVFEEDVRKLHGKQGALLVEEYSWDKCCAILLKRLRAIQEEED